MQRRLSFGFSDGVGTPGRINMSRRLSIASDASTGSGSLQRKHDCILGELHSAYEDLCKKVSPHSFFLPSYAHQSVHYFISTKGL